MSSITYWYRLEPRPRTPNIDESLAAQVRDPFWMLTRQWQFGEFHGEDAGSPAFIQSTAQLGLLHGWAVAEGDVHPLPADVPLETMTLAEGFSPTDLSLAVELGQVFEQALVQAGRADLIANFRQAYPLQEQVEERDREALRFLQVIAERGTHGVKLFLAADNAAPNLPDQPALRPADEEVVREALEQVRAWVRDTLGMVGHEDAPAWNPERLEYDLQVIGQKPNGDPVVLSAHPDRHGQFEWYAFDVQARTLSGEGSVEEMPRVRRSLIPGNVRFRGMPQPRWWAFETNTLNPEAIRPEKREIAKLIVLDFMLVHSNDWYVFPLRQPLGTLCAVESLVVCDVFGVKTLIERADRKPAPAGQRWTMFSPSIEGTDDIGDFFVVSPTAGETAQTSDPREEVSFVRDEMANMAWAIERVIENQLGEPWLTHERALAGAKPESLTPSRTPDAPPVRYLIQTSVPEHWIPFLPVALDRARGEITFERGVLLRSASEVEPLGSVSRILNPTRFDEGHYRISEEEIPRVGVRLVRVANRGRWTDGSTHIWIARSKSYVIGEERSGLLFDVAIVRK